MRSFHTCRQCLARSSSRPSPPGIPSRFYTGAQIQTYSHSVAPVASSTATSLRPYPLSPSQPVIHPERELADSLLATEIPHRATDSGILNNVDPGSAPPRQGQYAKFAHGDRPSNRELKYFDPIPRTAYRRQAWIAKHKPKNSRRNIGNARDLKEKIFLSQYEYSDIKADIKRFFEMSSAETKQTLSQLQRVLWGRTKEEATGELDAFILWKREFSCCMSEARSGQSGTARSAEPQIQEMLDCVQNDPSTFEAIWHRLSLGQRRNQWQQVVAAAMSERPSVLYRLIRTTFDQAYCANYILEDVVHFLEQNTTLSNNRTGVATKMADFLTKNATFRYVQLYQSSLRHVCTRTSLDKLWEFYEESRHKDQYWAPNTLLHLADRFGRAANHKDHAMQVFSHLAQLPGFNINSPESASVCTTLLGINKDGPLPEGQAEPDLLFKFLLELGLKPNMINWTALMRNFCVRGHLDTGWKVLEQLLQQGHQPDSRVLSILMNRSKIDADVASARNVMKLAIASKSWSTSLVNDFLAAIYCSNEKQETVYRRQRKSNNAWRPMLQVYSTFFDLAPLQQLTLFPLENVISSRGALYGKATEMTDLAAALPPLKETELLTPNSHTLVLMFGAHMRSLQNPVALRRYYRLYKRLLEQNHPLVERMVRRFGTRMYDIFLQSFMQFRTSVPMALRILLGMLRRGRQKLRDERRRWKYQSPSVHSWTIIVNGLKNHQRSIDAVRILDVMTRVGGVAPNLATWNALIGALATQGRLPQIVKAINCLEAAEQTSGERTMDALKLLTKTQQSQLLELLEAERTQAAANAGVRSFDNVQGHVASKPSQPQEADIKEFLRLALPTEDFAEITGDSRKTASLLDIQHAHLILWRIQRSFEGLVAVQPRRSRLHREHSLWLGRQTRRRLQRTASQQ